MNYNHAVIVGRATAAPELRTTPSGSPVTTFGVATNRAWTDKSGQKQEEVEFHNVVIFGRLAEIASNYVTKGSLLLVEGRLNTRSWEDKDGTTRRTTQIVASGIQFGPKSVAKTKGATELAAEETLPADGELPDITLGGDEEDTGMKPLL